MPMPRALGPGERSGIPWTGARQTSGISDPSRSDKALQILNQPLQSLTLNILAISALYCTRVAGVVIDFCSFSFHVSLSHHSSSSTPS